MKHLDFEQPLVIRLKVTSPLVDFNFGSLGYVEEVNVNYLPPYPSTPEKIKNEILNLVNQIEPKAFDNLGGLEDVIDEASGNLGTFTKLIEKLTDDKVFGKDGVIYASQLTQCKLTASVLVEERQSTEEVKDFFKDK